MENLTNAVNDNSYWIKTGPHAAFPSHEWPSSANVVIIGGGIMGSATAYYLTRIGIKPVVLERNFHPGYGATGRNGGLLISGPPQAYATIRSEHGVEEAMRMQRLTEITTELIETFIKDERLDAHDIEFDKSGVMAFPEDQQEADLLKESTSLLQKDGFSNAAKWISPQDVSQTVGVDVDPKTVAFGAQLKPNDGVIHSFKYVTAVASAASRRGAQFFFNTNVASLNPANSSPNGGWRICLEDGKHIDAQRVLVAVNAWTENLFPQLARVVRPTRGTIVVTSPVAYMNVKGFIGNKEYGYGRQLFATKTSGSILFGGLRNTQKNEEIGVPPKTKHDNLPARNPELLPLLDKTIHNLFRFKEPNPVVMAWHGLMGYTPDDHPLVGRYPGKEGVFISAGFCGHGMPYSLSVPLGMARIIGGSLGNIDNGSHYPQFNFPDVFDPSRYLDQNGNLRSDQNHIKAGVGKHAFVAKL